MSILDLIRSLGQRRLEPTWDDVAAAGRAAVAEAERLWRLDIRDPSIRDHSDEADRWRGEIDAMIRSVDGVGWSWLQPYPGDGYGEEWCGNFIAKCMRASIPLKTRRSWFPSTYRLDRWARYEALDDKTPNPEPKRGSQMRVWFPFDEHTRQLPIGCVPQAGDILLVGPVPGGKAKDWGTHCTLVKAYDPDTQTFSTFEGNAFGHGPKGDRREGVVTWRRPLGLRKGDDRSDYHARRLIRPAPSDIAAA